MNNTLELTIDNLVEPIIELKQDSEEPVPIYNIHICKILTNAKNRINNNKDWDKGKKLSND